MTSVPAVTGSPHGARTMDRPLAVVLLALAVLAIVPGVARARWEKLSPDDVSVISEPDIGQVNSAGVDLGAVWPAYRGDSVPQAIELRTFRSTPAAPAGGSTAGPVVTPVSGWNAIGNSPVLTGFSFAPTDRNAHDPATDVLFNAFDHNGDGDGGIFLAGPLTPPRDDLPYQKRAAPRSGDLDVVSVFDGSQAGALWADSSSGILSTYRDTRAPQPSEADLQAPLGGCCAYHPSLAAQHDGRVWLNWYSNASANTGLYMVPLDPATGVAAGPTLKVPGSESTANNFQRMPMACRTTCRIFYATQPNPAGPNKLSSWAPGDPAPTSIPGAADLTGNAVVGAVQEPGLENASVVWYDRGTNGSGSGYRATFGDARGVNRQVFRLGTPGGAVEFGQLQAVALGPYGANLLLIGVAGGGGTHDAVWADMITPTGDPTVPMTDGFAKPKIARADSAIAVVSGVQSRRGLQQRGILVELEASRPESVAVNVCVNRGGHPPSPCRSAASRFRQPGLRKLRIRLGRAVGGGRSLRVTLKAAGKSNSVTVKPHR
jgi:hypothetical protein